MQIRSRRGTVTRLTGNLHDPCPSGEPGYLYERELSQARLKIQIYFEGHFEMSTRREAFKPLGDLSDDEVLIELCVLHYTGDPRYNNDGYLKIWRGFFTSRERLLDEVAQPIPPLFALDMSLDEVEQVKLEDLQGLINEIDKIEDTPDALKQIALVAAFSDLWLMQEC